MDRSGRPTRPAPGEGPSTAPPVHITPVVAKYPPVDCELITSIAGLRWRDQTSRPAAQDSIRTETLERRIDEIGAPRYRAPESTLIEFLLKVGTAPAMGQLSNGRLFQARAKNRSRDTCKDRNVHVPIDARYAGSMRTVRARWRSVVGRSSSQ